MKATTGNPEWWERAIAGVCSHGGHGWDGDTCSDADSEAIEPMFRVIADGTPWIDPDGHTEWAENDAASLADHVSSLGYAVTIEAV